MGKKHDLGPRHLPRRQRLIREHGDEAPIHAAMRHDELLEAGDMEGCAVWRRIITAVKELLATDATDATKH